MQQDLINEGNSNRRLSIFQGETGTQPKKKKDKERERDPFYRPTNTREFKMCE